jgi:elongation factor P--(R)-beta-lysine ligase
MSWWLPHEFERKKPFLIKRMELLKAVRNFFGEQGFLEVETPALQVCPSMDAHVHGIGTEGGLYLHTSPELAMKKLLVAGLPKIYQICHVFRGDSSSSLHSPEFTMLEWYRAGAGYQDIMEDCTNLLRKCANSLNINKYTYKTCHADPFLNWNVMSVSEAFENHAEIYIHDHLENTESFFAALREKGIRTAPGDSWDDLFFRMMAEKIEPHLGQGVPCILYDYPACLASLARKKPEDPRFAERFEVYVCGIELANGFGELTDAAEQRRRFEEEMSIKERLYGIRYQIDEDFMWALEYGMPESGGIALGLDRLAMLVTGAEDITQVLAATVQDPVRLQVLQEYRHNLSCSSEDLSATASDRDESGLRTPPE